MKVLICGAGQVGFGIAERLAAEQNDVTLVDTSPELVKIVSDKLDVRGVVGHGSYPDTLRKAGAEDSDMIIAATLSDEINMVACQVAHSLFNIPTKIARIRAQNYLEPVWRDLFSRENLPIDVIISPEIEVGEAVLRSLAHPGAFEIAFFADEKIAVIGVSCEEDCPLVDTPLNQLTELFPDLLANIVGVLREGKLFVPGSKDQLLIGDDVFIITAKEHIDRTLSAFGHEEKMAQRIIIAGGGNIGCYVAQKIEERQERANIKIIEFDRQRAMKAADSLEKAVVLHGSALDEELLREAGIAEVDTLIALTNDDKVNLLSSVVAKKAGCPKVLSLLSDKIYEGILDPLGIDFHINPRATTVSTILQHVRRGRIRGVYSVASGGAEVIEAEALQTSTLVDVPLREADLPGGVRIGAILRDGEVVIPKGDTRIQRNDRIIIFALNEHVHLVEQMFRVSLEFF